MDYTPQAGAYLRLNHRCIQCRTQDAFTLNGRTYCAECAEKHRVYNKLRYSNSPGYRNRHTEHKKERYRERKEKGLCVSCGKRPAKPGRVRCEICLAKMRRKACDRYREKRFEQMKGREP